MGLDIAQQGWIYKDIQSSPALEGFSVIKKKKRKKGAALSTVEVGLYTSKPCLFSPLASALFIFYILL
jgi:hypothetical protein